MPEVRLIDANALYREVKTECNPYGKPTIGFDDGKKVLELIDAAPTIEADIDRAAILRLCNQIEMIIVTVCNIGFTLQEGDEEAIMKRTKAIRKELTGDAAD